jgi:hypothetical protein
MPRVALEVQGAQKWNKTDAVVSISENICQCKVATRRELRTINFVVESQDCVRATSDEVIVVFLALCNRCANGISRAK